jgi:hypothetical protein
MQFTCSVQLLEAAWICSSKGDPAQTMLYLGKRIDLETLAPLVPQSEQGRIEAINILTRSLLQSKERDMEGVITAWTAGIKGAKALKSEGRYVDAIANFEIMRVIYAGERRIDELLPLTKHWSEDGG